MQPYAKPHIYQRHRRHGWYAKIIKPAVQAMNVIKKFGPLSIPSNLSSTETAATLNIKPNGIPSNKPAINLVILSIPKTTPKITPVIVLPVKYKTLPPSERNRYPDLVWQIPTPFRGVLLQSELDIS